MPEATGPLETPDPQTSDPQNCRTLRNDENQSPPFPEGETEALGGQRFPQGHKMKAQAPREQRQPAGSRPGFYPLCSSENKPTATSYQMERMLIRFNSNLLRGEMGSRKMLGVEEESLSV